MLSSVVAKKIVGFDTRVQGTTEDAWLEVLHPARPWQLDANIQQLVVVTPHPDDETLGAGGLIFHALERSLRVTVVSLTDGEAARGAKVGLGPRRHEELLASMSAIAGNRDAIQVRRLRYPDGHLAQNEAEVCNAILGLAPAAKSLWVCPFEEDGHPDHEAAARACIRAAASLSAPVIRYPIWAWHRFDLRGFDQFQLGRFQLSPAAVAAKRKALSCFPSQFDEGGEAAIVPPHVLRHFRRDFEIFLL